MKTIAIIIGIAFLIISGVMISLVIKGGALKPAGVIKPAEISQNPSEIGKHIAIRLYADFHAANQVIWRLEEESFADIARVAVANLRGPVKPTLIDLRSGSGDACSEKCWYLQTLDGPPPNELPAVEIFVQRFKRDEPVPEECEEQKILTPVCMRPITAREVRRKIKTDKPHFFMQRYLDSQFFLYLEE